MAAEWEGFSEDIWDSSNVHRPHKTCAQCIIRRITVLNIYERPKKRAHGIAFLGHTYGCIYIIITITSWRAVQTCRKASKAFFEELCKGVIDFHSYMWFLESVTELRSEIWSRVNFPKSDRMQYCGEHSETLLPLRKQVDRRTKSSLDFEVLGIILHTFVRLRSRCFLFKHK